MGGWSNPVTKAGASKGSFLGSRPLPPTPASTPWTSGVNSNAAKPNTFSAASNAAMAQFLAGPIRFMQTEVVVPTSNAPVGHTMASNGVFERFYTERKGREKVFASGEESKLVYGGQLIRFMNFQKLGDQYELKVSPEPRTGTLPIYFLPWDDRSITQLTIPEIPSNLADWDDEEYPRFFFTSGLSGCTVFFQGTPKNPTIHHAGISLAKIEGDSDQFWIDQMTALGTGWDKAELKAVVKSSEYLPSDRASLQNYLRWLDTPTTKNSALTLEVIECTACVFGIRFNKDWTFYLQERIVSNTMRFLNENEVHTIKGEFNTYVGAKDNNKVASVARTVRVPRRFGPFRFFDKVSKIYQVQESSSVKPIGVREVFPKGKNVMLPNRFTVTANAT